MRWRARETVELVAGKTATADLKLKPAAVTSADLTNAEWLLSAPGPEDMKRAMLNCIGLPPAAQVFSRSKHSAADFLQVFDRMGGYYPGASELQPQRLVGAHRRPAVSPAIAQRFAEYLASINLSSKPVHGFELKTTRARAGRATRVIITEYDLPRKEIQPHDVIVDPDGMVWYSHFGEQFLSKLDPEDRHGDGLPDPGAEARPSQGHARPRSRRGRRHLGRLMYQTGMARFDRAHRALPHLSGAARNGRPTPPSSRTSRWRRPRSTARRG